jgi:hypothetical protein
LIKWKERAAQVAAAVVVVSPNGAQSQRLAAKRAAQAWISRTNSAPVAAGLHHGGHGTIQVKMAHA